MHFSDYEITTILTALRNEHSSALSSAAYESRQNNLAGSQTHQDEADMIRTLISKVERYAEQDIAF